MSVLKADRKGYQHTLLGWLPDDWQLKELHTLALTVFSNVDKHIIEGEKEVLLCNYKDVYYNNYIFSKLSFSKGTVKVSEYEKFKVKKGDVIITKDSEDKSDIAISAFVLEDVPNLVCGYHLALIRPTKSLLDGLFLSFALRSYNVNHYFQKRANGITRFGLDTDTVKSSLIPLPTISEQQKIAIILSTWDEGVTQLQSLISNLKQRNKGLIQKLLTGKKRLPGFEKRDWVKLSANLIFKSVSKKNNGPEQLLSATQEFGMIPRSMLENRVTMPSGETGSFKLVDKGDFIISLRSFQGGIEYSDYRGLVSPAYTVLKPILTICDDFYKHYFKSYDFIGRLAVAVIGIRDGKQISYEDFSTLKLPYPDLCEQQAIIEIITKAVAEVKLFEQKLSALQQQKKGIMQKLLTGQIRVNHLSQKNE